MLMLNRIEGEEVHIECQNGDRIIVKFVEKRHGKRSIRLGFEAPKSYRIIRPDAINQEPRKENP